MEEGSPKAIACAWLPTVETSTRVRGAGGNRFQQLGCSHRRPAAAAALASAESRFSQAFKSPAKAASKALG
eukprot:3693659-Karenia_brevis.AAC.1